MILVAPALAADVLWYTGNGGDDLATPDAVEEVLGAVDSTDTWPASLAGYRLVFLVVPTEGFASARVAELSRPGVIIVGEYGSYTADGVDTWNALAADLGLETRWDAADTDCVSPRVATGTGAALVTAAPHPAYICADTLTLGAPAEALYLGESGAIIAAVEGEVVLLGDSNLLVSDIPLNRDNDSFIQSLYVASCDTPDWDGDGSDGALCGGDDCDDGDAAVGPGATEVCDGVDDDCDGEVDEAGSADERTWYRDRDGDRMGDLRADTRACSAPPGFVGEPGDCDDGEADVHPGAEEHCDGVDEDCNGAIDNDAVDPSTWYQDNDHDGAGTDASVIQSCAWPSGYGYTNDDCDDTDILVHPGADEHCDGIDEDCDASIDELAVDAPTAYSDYDHDGVGGGDFTVIECEVPDGYALVEGDCDDHDDTIHPGADELCDEVDQDCDGEVDEDAVDATGWYPDADDDGYGADVAPTYACERPPETTDDPGDCDDAEGDRNPGEAEVCDGLDQDCDHAADEGLSVQPWYEDKDGDGVGVQKGAIIACAQPEGYVDTFGDCNDADPTRIETCAIEHERPPKQEEPAGCGCQSASPATLLILPLLRLRRRTTRR